MGLKWTSLMCVLWSCLVLFSLYCGCHCNPEIANTKALQDGVAEPRRHRLQLLFPLLLRISTRLATLVSTALMGLLGIVLFVIFSKKALIVSLFALFLSLSSKYNNKSENVYIHKVNSYPDYNDEEHIHYYHHEPPEYKNYEIHNGRNKWKTNFKRRVSSFSYISSTPLPHSIKPFQPLSRFQKRSDLMNRDSHSVSFPFAFEQKNQNFAISEAKSIHELNSLK